MCYFIDAFKHPITYDSMSGSSALVDDSKASLPRQYSFAPQ